MIDPSAINEMLSQFQDKAKALEEKNQNLTFTAKSGGGLVSATVNGKGELIDLLFDDSLLEDKESLQILLMSAINDAYSRVEDNKKNTAFSMLGDLVPFPFGKQ